MRSLTDRFWSKVEGDRVEDCWVWRGSRNGAGYGRFHLDAHRCVGAHRFAYELLRAEVEPSWLHLDHLCSNPPCVNPWHLEPVAPNENAVRARDRGKNPGICMDPFKAPITHAQTRSMYRKAFDSIEAEIRAGVRVVGAEIRPTAFNLSHPSTRALRSWLLKSGLVEEINGRLIVSDVIPGVTVVEAKREITDVNAEQWYARRGRFVAEGAVTNG